MKYSVYLAGPITGLTYDEGNDWRADIGDVLDANGIEPLSPLRWKEVLRDINRPLTGTGEEYAHLTPLATPKGVMTRDHFDCTRCDVLLVNLVGAKKISVGTVMEIAWAHTHQIPIVVAMEPGNVHEHMMINEAIGFRLHTLDEAVNVVLAVLKTGA